MAIGERVSYAIFGAIFGALLGIACWWLYGIAHSLNYDGPGMDPVLRHWVTHLTAVFAALGFLFRARVGDFLGDALSAIFHFEAGANPGNSASPFFAIVFLAITIAAIWFTVPK
ncbi:MAG: hypothetical protein FIA97_14250 [Methylococcaceae bacterium]|nr:hypothetical protein [Methylococcaceae bacterium]